MRFLPRSCTLCTLYTVLCTSHCRVTYKKWTKIFVLWNLKGNSDKPIFRETKSLYCGYNQLYAIQEKCFTRGNLVKLGESLLDFCQFLKVCTNFFFFYSRKKLTYTSIPYLGTNLLRPLSPLNLSYSGKLLNFFSLTQRTFRLQLIFIFDYRLAFIKIGTIHPLNLKR